MLNKSHTLSKYKANSGHNLKKNFDQKILHFDPDVRVFVLSNWDKMQLSDKFSAVMSICLAPFSKL